MRKGILFFILLFIFNCGYSQLFPVSQNSGSANTLAINVGGFKTNAMMQLGNYPDTAAANSANYVKNYDGAMIRTGGEIISVRSAAKDKWNQLAFKSDINNVWGILGNNNIVDGTNFIGTTTNVPLNFRVNNDFAGRIDADLYNSFYGINSGNNSATGNSNTAIGGEALNAITTGFQNTGIGRAALLNNNTGVRNTAIGRGALLSNTTGIGNTALGYAADVLSLNLTNATAIGSNALIGKNNAISLGDSSANTKVGIGTAFPTAALHIFAPDSVPVFIAQSNITGLTRFAIDDEKIKMYSPDNTNNFSVTNDSTTSNKRVNYLSNIRGTFTDFSHVDKGYVDSSINAGSINIYNSNGTLTSPRTLDGNNKSLIFNNLDGFGVNSNDEINLSSPTNITYTAGAHNFYGGMMFLNNEITSSSSLLDSVLVINSSRIVKAKSLADVNNLSWKLTGNSGTIDGTNFIGTTDNAPLNFRVNNQKAGRISSTGALTSLGYQAGDQNSTGTNNTSLGYQASRQTTVGQFNTAVGSFAMEGNINGSFNAAFGASALLNNTASLNSAFGNQSLMNNSGISNTGVGHQSLYSNTTGSTNTSVGSMSLRLNTTGVSNTATGYQSLSSNTTSSNNSAYGWRSLFNNTGARNSAFGNASLYNNSTGFELSAFGDSALHVNTTGNYSAAFGSRALRSNTTGTENVAFGGYGLYNNTEGNYNTANGASSLYYNTTGNENTAVGDYALQNNTTGSFNTGIGSVALFGNTIGSRNVAIGAYSRPVSSGLNHTIAIGYAAIVKCDSCASYGDTTANVKHGFGTGYPTERVDIRGSLKIVDGTQGASKLLQSDADGKATWVTNSSVISNAWNILGNAGTVDGTNFIGTTDNIPFNIRVNNQKSGRIEQTSFGNTFYGYQSGNANTSGLNNVAIGYTALQLSIGQNNNTAVGASALKNSLTGADNTAVGKTTLQSNTTGSNNTGIGSSVLTGNTVGNNNTGVGASANVISNNLTNATAIGYNSKIGIDNAISLGDSTLSTKTGIGTSFPDSTLTVRGGIKFITGSEGNGKILTSDANGGASWQTPTAITNIYNSNGTLTSNRTLDGSNTYQLSLLGLTAFNTQVWNGSFETSRMYADDAETTFSNPAGDRIIQLGNNAITANTDSMAVIGVLTAENDFNSNKTPHVLSTTTGIDGKTIATTNLYTVPTGKTLIVTEAIVRVTTATAITVPPTLGIGIAAGESDIYAPVSLTGLNATTKIYRFSASGTYASGSAGQVIKAGIKVGATATTMTISIDLIGYLL